MAGLATVNLRLVSAGWSDVQACISVAAMVMMIISTLILLRTCEAWLNGR